MIQEKIKGTDDIEALSDDSAEEELDFSDEEYEVVEEDEEKVDCDCDDCRAEKEGKVDCDCGDCHDEKEMKIDCDCCDCHDEKEVKVDCDDEEKGDCDDEEVVKVDCDDEKVDGDDEKVDCDDDEEDMKVECDDNEEVKVDYDEGEVKEGCDDEEKVTMLEENNSEEEEVDEVNTDEPEQLTFVLAKEEEEEEVDDCPLSVTAGSILLVQPTTDESRTYLRYNTLSDSMKGLLRIFEGYLRQNPEDEDEEVKYSMDDIFHFIDKLEDLICLVRVKWPSQMAVEVRYAAYNKDWIKIQLHAECYRRKRAEFRRLHFIY